MFRRNNKWWTTLVLVLFVAGFAGCLLAGHDEGAVTEADCCSHCFCADLGLPTTTVLAPCATGKMDSRPAAELLKLPLFADSIFQPPRA